MNRVIALGFFDGVHLGHGALLRRTRELAAQQGYVSQALTFSGSPGKDCLLLTSVEDRTRLIRTLYGIDEVVCLPFDEALRTMRWDDFVRRLQSGGVRHLVCGYDYRFGHRGEGTPDKLRALCQTLGLGCEIVPRLEKDGITVSSSYLRELVAGGQIERAAEFYGHPHVLSGVVRSGAHLGHRLGFPTANLIPDGDLLLPKHGVYAVRAFTQRGDFVGACNVGLRPTVQGAYPTVETWLHGFDGDLYGTPLRVEFHRFLRPERTFSSLDTLAEQIRRDQAQAIQYFQQEGGSA